MGQMHFHVPDAAAEFFHDCWWKDAYLCGIEGVPWQTRNVFHPSEKSGGGALTSPAGVTAEFLSSGRAGGRFTLNRNVATSAKLLITCPVDGIGYRVLSTCSLRCCETPHRLVVELARGSCHRLRTQSDIWRRGGLTLSDRFDELLDQGTQLFLDALQPPARSAAEVNLNRTALADGETDVESTHCAIRAIAVLEQAAAELSGLFSTQSLAFRRGRESRLSTMMAVGLLPPPLESTARFKRQPPGQASSLRSAPGHAATSATLDDTAAGLEESTEAMGGVIAGAFNAAAVRISWGDIEDASGTPDFAAAARTLQECADRSMRVIGGPLLDHRDGLLPDWLTLMDNDFEQLMTSMTTFVESTVNRFRGRVHLWNAASGLNVKGPLSLDDAQVMRLSIGVLQTIRRCDPNTPVIMSIEQPCGEYLAQHADGISPIHFADALLRSGLGLAGIGLNFRFGYDVYQTQPRSPLEFAQLIDRWATLCSPLLVQLSIPAAPGIDPSASFKTSPVSLSPNLDDDQHKWSRQQRDFARPLIDILLAKQIVHAVVWDGASDQMPHVMPHAGVLDRNGKPRPMLSYLKQTREELLM